ncbi:MAG: hypothetical protein ACOX9R_07175 [Armatimonadota bacterium]|jgi:hypothetical protein
MPRHAMLLILTAVLLASADSAFAGDAALVFGDGECEAPFNLVIPADAIRAEGGLVVVTHEGDAEWLVFQVGLDEVSVAVRRAEGVTELATAQAALPADGGQVVLKRTLDGVSVAYDASTVLRAEADLPDGGRWGVVDAPVTLLDEIMLQPTDAIVFADDFMRLPGQPATWDRLGGDWRVAQLESARFSANAFTLLGSATAAGPALATAGYWFYEDLTVEVSVRSSVAAGGFGVGLAGQPDGDCHLLRFLPQSDARGVLQLVRVRRGEETVLDEAAAVAHPDEWHRLAISGVRGRLSGALNGVELVAVEAPTLAHGQIALWVAGTEPVAFDDVEAYSGPRAVQSPVVLSYEAQAADPAAQAFIGDQYMQEWADERDQWLPGSGGVWHAGHYWGDVELAWEVTERSLGDGVALHICVPASGETLSPPADAGEGCRLELAPAEGTLAMTLREGAEVRARVAPAMPELPVTATLRRTGDRVEALLGDEIVGSFEATTPAGGKVGLTGRMARRQAGRLRIVSRNMIDSTFRAAPTDWHIGSGEWGVSSRWDCTPRWSWFQGRSDDLASVWTRRQFGGDLVVEFFAGISMDQPWAPFYQHPGNLCVTLGGDNATPGSGYSLIFAGWGNSAAGIFRRGELVAKVEGFTMPDILDSLGGTTGRDDAHKLHNEWWRIRAERIGSTVRLLVDGKLAASFDDPEPLPGGAVGIWTLNQAMTVARARIYYEESEHAMPGLAEEREVRPIEGVPLPRFGPPRVVSTFEHGISGWEAAAPGSCEVRLAERDAGRCMEIVNPTAGGSFAVTAPFEDVDLRRHPLLAFEYAIPEDVCIDAFVTVGGRRHRVTLTGRDEPAPGIEELGRVADVRADDRWREARIDLLGLLAPQFEADRPLVLDALEFAAYAAPEYMRAGVGGNPAGASWRLDNVYLGGVASGAVTLQTARDLTVAAPGCGVTRDIRAGRAEHRVAPRRSGLVPVTLSSGRRMSTDLIAFDVEPPSIEPLEPRPGESWLAPALTVAISDAGPAGIDECSLEAGIADRRLRWGDSGLGWDAAECTLVLDLREIDLQLAAGDPVEVRVIASDRVGNRAAPLELTFTPDPAADSSPPEPPALTGGPSPLLDADFESGLSPIEPWGVDAAVELRRARGPAEGNPDGGAWCLEAHCTKLGGLFGVSLGCAPFEASRFPVLQFDYCAPEELRVDLIVAVDGSRRVIKFTDNDQTWPVSGRIDAVTDGRWHRATVDLHAMLASAFGRNAPLVVTEIAFASSGWPGNREGTRWWLDNVRLHAALDLSAPAGDLTLVSRDESGLRGFAWLVDGSPASEPPADATAGELRAALAGLSGRLTWLHAAAIDGAGNRSSAVHIPLRITAVEDAVPPVASAPTPADGERACPSSIFVPIHDEGAGVSPADLRLTINERTWTVADDELAWDAASGTLRWTLPAGLWLGDDRSRVRCRLDAADLAGNVMEPLEWAFTLDHALDDGPPSAPEVSYVPARSADRNDFEEGTGGWGNFVAGQVLRRAQGGATGPGCAELRHLGGRGSGFVLVRDFGEDWREFPMVRFRYRAVNAPRAQLQVFGTTFDGTRDRWTPLGSLPVSGERWLTAELDIAQALRRTDPSLDLHRIFLSIDLPPDGALLVDDYAMHSQAATRAEFRWAAPASPSGIAGYSWVLDDADDTVPPEEILGTGLHAQFADLEPGRHVFHLRARDGAGNWGATTHLSFELTAAD